MFTFLQPSSTASEASKRTLAPLKIPQNKKEIKGPEPSDDNNQDSEPHSPTFSIVDSETSDALSAASIDDYANTLCENEALKAEIKALKFNNDSLMAQLSDSQSIIDNASKIDKENKTLKMANAYLTTQLTHFKSENDSLKTQLSTIIQFAAALTQRLQYLKYSITTQVGEVFGLLSFFQHHQPRPIAYGLSYSSSDSDSPSSTRSSNSSSMSISPTSSIAHKL